MKEGHKIAGEYRRQMTDDERSRATMLVTATLEEIVANYPYDSVKKFLREARNDILENLDLFKPQRDQTEDQENGDKGKDEIEIEDPFHVYDINVLLDNSDSRNRTSNFICIISNYVQYPQRSPFPLSSLC